MAWSVVSAPGLVVFSDTNLPDPLLTFAERGTNEVQATVTANGYQASARVAIVLAPDITTMTESLAPVEDTYVRDGTFANDNYRLDTTLQLKKNSATGYITQSPSVSEASRSDSQGDHDKTKRPPDRKVRWPSKCVKDKLTATATD